MRAAALLLLLPTLSLAQSPRPEDLGTVTGHITCADTQRPARLSEVRLVAANITPKTAKPTDDNDVAFGNNLPAVQTDLTGGYTIRNVHPGQYYLRVDLPGYITPLLNFTRDDLAKPTPEIQQRIQNDLQRLTIAPHSTLTADVTLRRGASISGSVLYDDGSPAINLHVRLLGRDPKGIFAQEVQLNSPWGIGNTDAHGHYCFDSLPEGQYAVEADLTLTSQDTSRMPMPNGTTVDMTVVKILFSLPVYSGSVIRRKDAAPVKLSAGQEASDVDITIPISQLHDVSGSLLAKDGHALNGGKVQLLFADDRSQFAEVDLNNESGLFDFAYVPDGNYILSVTEAKDVGSVEVPNPPGASPRTHTEHPTLHTYGTTEQPLAVQTDLQSLNITVPDKTTTTASTQ
jgi:hypothetical protein